MSVFSLEVHLKAKEKIYDYYDQPLLYLVSGDNGQKYIGLAADCKRDKQCWAYSPVSEQEVKLFEDGELSLREIFKDRDVFWVDEPKDESNPGHILIKPSESTVSGPVRLSDEHLPDEDHFIEFSGPNE